MSPVSPPRLFSVLSGQTTDRPSIWSMRQAGRFRPPYRALRIQAPDVITFGHNLKMATEAILKAISRFPPDAAMVCADILLIPRALAPDVWFERGEVSRDALALDAGARAAQGLAIQTRKSILGAPNPLLTSEGGRVLDRQTDERLSQRGAGPCIFNLGKGISPGRPIKPAARTAERVTLWNTAG
ncbi:MAG TPA: uroporphyrinogen decarboxylase family protein [Caulobacteraceae bacterium]|nr:uroporphyrinogen decarboxylase family protein [Caulobacteraceae bacterium]